jgi:hypothetical protein
MPEFLQGILPSQITIYSYGALIALGAFLGYFYTSVKAGKKFGLSQIEIVSGA